MNSVYYVFLVIIILSFITGLIITFIDNAHGESFDEAPSPKMNNSMSNTQKMPAPIRTNSLGNTFQNLPNPVVNNTVPYLPVNASSSIVPPIVYENPTVNEQPVVQPAIMPAMQQPVMTPQVNLQTPVMQQQPVVQPMIQPAAQPVAQPVVHPIIQSLPQLDTQPVPQQPMIVPLIQPVANRNIQINTINDSKNGYFNVPVLVPMSMDDDSL